MDQVPSRLLPVDPQVEPSASAKALGIVLSAFLEVLRILGLLFLVIFLVALAENLARAGGAATLLQSISAAFLGSLQFIEAFISGEAGIAVSIPMLLGRSVGLLLLALLPGAFVGVALGGLAAMRPQSRLSSILVTVSILGVSTPSYVVAMFLIWSVVGFYQSSGIRLLPVAGFGWDVHLLLPTLVLATRPAAQMMRLTYATLLDIFEADYIRTAYGKGLRERRVFWRHALRNAGVPLLTTVVVSLQFSLSILPVVEYIFNWPGIGLSLLQSVQQGDLGSATVMLLPLVLMFLAASAALRLTYGLIDPRLKDMRGGLS
jgi:peptide/nickel transport system permease protein